MLAFKRKSPPPLSYPNFHKMWAKSHKGTHYQWRAPDSLIDLVAGSPGIEDGIFILTAFQSYFSAHNEEEPLAVPCRGCLQQALSPMALKLPINIICL